MSESHEPMVCPEIDELDAAFAEANFQWPQFDGNGPKYYTCRVCKESLPGPYFWFNSDPEYPVCTHCILAMRKMTEDYFAAKGRRSLK